MCLDMVREARAKGLKAPIIFMGYFNPIRCYGEERVVKDCQEAGVSGFIVVELPPEESAEFRGYCTQYGYGVRSGQQKQNEWSIERQGHFLWSIN